MLKSTLLLLLSCLIFTTGCGSNDDDDQNDPQEEVSTPDANAGRVTLWDRSSGYDAAIFLPADYGTDAAKDYPLILSLHGFNGSVLNSDGSEVGGERTGFIKQVWDTPLAASYPAIVIAPDIYPADDSENRLWDHDRLREVIQEALATYQIDPNRIVVTGHSAGSIAAQELALRSKDLIAGIMPGAFEAVIKADICALEDLPIWSFGNRSDVLFQATSWSGVESDIKDCPNYTSKFQLTINENGCGHGCWDEHWARSDVQEWLINQEKVR